MFIFFHLQVCCRQNRPGLKPGPSLLSDAGRPVCPLCEMGASDATVTVSAKQASRWAADPEKGAERK